MTRTVEDMFNTIGHGPPDLKRPLLLPTHTAAASANVSIAHAQLRHLISCPSQRGIVYYVGGKSILERDVLNPGLPPRCIIDLEFPPTCFAATSVASNPTTILFAAGGYSSDLHLSLHTFPPTPQTPSSSTTPSPASPKLIWRHSHRLRGRYEIVNSILFTPASLTDDTPRSASDIRVAVGGNDAAVKLFEVAMEPKVKDEQRLQECGGIKLETPINHMSLSPDGRTLLCVGDTPKAYLFSISPGSTVTFVPLAVYTLPPPPPRIPIGHMPHSSINPHHINPPSITSRTSAIVPTNSPINLNPHPSLINPPPSFASLACFSTAWSADGLKFAVASQEGQLCAWDVRSATPLLSFWTPYRHNSLLAQRARMGEWDWEDLGGHLRHADDATNNGPDSGIRNMRFSTGDGGRELLVFVEHTYNVHAIDARTFDITSHTVMRFPELSFPLSSPAPSMVPTEPRSPSPGDGGRVQRERAQTIGPGDPYWRILRERRTPSPSPRREAMMVVPARSRSRTRSPRREAEVGGIRRGSMSPPHEQRELPQTQAPDLPSRTRTRAAWSVPSGPGSRGEGSAMIIVRGRSRSRSRSRSGSRSHSRFSSRGNTVPTRVIVARSRSRSRSHSPVFIMPRERSRRERSPPSVVLPRRDRSTPPLRVDEQAVPWPRMLDADGDVIDSDAAVENASRTPWPSVLQPAIRGRGETQLEAVAEGGEPPPQVVTHLAGMCFDPSGGWVYVASENGIVEWRVREREEGKMCWGSGAWA